MQNPGKNENLLFYLLLLTGFFILLEISFFIQCNKTYLGDYTFVADNLHIPATILPGIFFFIFAQLFVHFAFTVIVWIETILISNLFSLTGNKKITLGISIWTLGVMTALAANQYYFPNAKFSELTSLVLVDISLTRFLLAILSSLCGIIQILALCGFMKLIVKRPWLVLLCSCFFLTGFILLENNKNISSDASSLSHPNIIIIGVDSLRPDFLSYFGHVKNTPFFDNFLNHSAVFSEAVTPLARTFPSWTSILTGQYPRQVNVRSNLAKQQDISGAKSLPGILQRNGYETIFATDETRFSNIDKNFGFDRVITPPMGLNDFLIGTFNDFPFSNLLVNTNIGKWLFPYSYANRPVYFTYQPESFLKLLQPALNEKRLKPLFLAVHFCLPHYPYLWASLPGNDYDGLARYEASIIKADEQLNRFVSMLIKYHLLNHAIVVLLSDHGEALELNGDRITEKDLFIISGSMNRKAPPRFYPPSLENEAVNQSAGHGTDVLGLPQYHSLLAFRLYGLGWQQKGIVSGVVSLLDVKPTLLQLIKLPAAYSSGESLIKNIRYANDKAVTHNHIFLESDYSPEAIRTVYPDARKVMLDGIQLFQIEPATARLVVKDSMTEMIISTKQYADIYDGWMLALYPQKKNLRMPILVNLVTGEWTNDLHSAFAKRSPALAMLKKLKNFYGDEI